MTGFEKDYPSPSLEEVHRTVKIPARWWRRMLAFAGPAYMVSVGYMDPGNWATDLAGGAGFGYSLLWILLMSNAMAVLLQTLSARLGIVTGHDLAQACRDDYPVAIRYVLFVLCEIAIAACDLAGVLGSAVGLNLLLGVPVLYGAIITGFDVLLLLLIQRLGIRKMEAFIVLLIATIGLCFIVEIFLSKPSPGGIAAGFVPTPLSGQALYVAIGIIGATVMPHNLYMHSALVQSRDVARSRAAVAEACKFNLIDSFVAINGAFFVNAAILIVAAAVFSGQAVPVELQSAPRLLQDILGSRVAPIAFAVALICAGQSSTVTGTLAGQIVMEGFLNFKMRPWLRRMMTRSLAIIPAVAVVAAAGEGWVFKLLILSQVVLSLQLPFALVPLVKFTSSRQKMGPFASRWWVKALAWLVTAVIIVLNAKLVWEEIGGWMVSAGSWAWLVAGLTLPLLAGLAGLLVWMVLRREKALAPAKPISPQEVAASAARGQKRFSRIGVALEAQSQDSIILAEAIALARLYRAELVLMHVVEGVGGQWYGPQTGDQESREDEKYVQGLAQRLKAELASQGVPDVRGALGYGQAPRQIARLAEREKVDLLVVGSHGHKGLADLLHGQTINGVRHELTIPILAVR